MTRSTPAAWAASTRLRVPSIRSAALAAPLRADKSVSWWMIASGRVRTRLPPVRSRDPARRPSPASPPAIAAARHRRRSESWRSPSCPPATSIGTSLDRSRRFLRLQRRASQVGAGGYRSRAAVSGGLSCLDPTLKSRDPVVWPRAVAWHRAVAKAFEDCVAVSATSLNDQRSNAHCIA